MNKIMSTLTDGSDEDDQSVECSLEEERWKKSDDRSKSFRLPDGTVVELDTSYHEGTDNGDVPSMSVGSIYGEPLSASEVLRRIGPDWSGDPGSHPGIIYHAQLLPDDTKDDSPLLKPRRPTVNVRCSDFISSLVQVAAGRWVFSGKINGWPGLGLDTPLELISITYRKSHRTRPSTIKRWWTANPGTIQHPPSIPPPDKLKNQSIRATLRTPQWAHRGYSLASPGFAFHYDGLDTVRYGTDMLKIAPSNKPEDNFIAVRAHHFRHRYALPKGKMETPKDLLTYHTGVLIEWECASKGSAAPSFISLIEMGIVHGLGGNRGRCNWYHDKDEEGGCRMYRSLPQEMILPWRWDMCELRFTDLRHLPTIDHFLKYIKTYLGPGKRFLDFNIHRSHPIRLTHRSRRDICQYILNNVGRDGSYVEIGDRNCQTFAADLFGFLVGKRGVELIPWAVSKVLPYTPRPHYFLYDPDMYQDDDLKSNGDSDHSAVVKR